MGELLNLSLCLSLVICKIQVIIIPTIGGLLEGLNKLIFNLFKCLADMLFNLSYCRLCIPNLKIQTLKCSKIPN
jgi:hypothetical protein